MERPRHARDAASLVSRAFTMKAMKFMKEYQPIFMVFMSFMVMLFPIDAAA